MKDSTVTLTSPFNKVFILKGVDFISPSILTKQKYFSQSHFDVFMSKDIFHIQAIQATKELKTRSQMHKEMV